MLRRMSSVRKIALPLALQALDTEGVASECEHLFRILIANADRVCALPHSPGLLCLAVPAISCGPVFGTGSRAIAGQHASL